MTSMSEKEIELRTETIKKLQKKLKVLEEEMKESIENMKSEIESNIKNINREKGKLKKKKHVYSMTNNKFEKVTEAISEYFNNGGYNYDSDEERTSVSIEEVKEHIESELNIVISKEVLIACISNIGYYNFDLSDLLDIKIMV